MVKDGERLPEDKDAAWHGYEESYTLSDEGDEVLLTASLDSDGNAGDSMNESFEKALTIVKTMAEE